MQADRDLAAFGCSCCESEERRRGEKKTKSCLECTAMKLLRRTSRADSKLGMWS